MKTRMGFISNSSTTSFFIYGVYLGSRQAKGLDTYDIVGTTSISTYSSPWGDGDIWIGVSWGDMEEEETKRQFKARVEKTLMDFFTDLQKKYPEWEIPEDLEFGSHEEAWGDG